MDLHGYLDRIGYDGPVEPTLECLTAVHRQQALTVPYENLDVQLKVMVGQDPAAIYDKVVVRRRGGWCYELNGMLQQALVEIGFDVQRVAGGVHRHETGDAAVGNHLVLLVRLDRVYVADLGLGDGLREPVPLEAGTLPGRASWSSGSSASTTATGASGTTRAATRWRSTSASILPTRRCSSGSATACRRRRSRASSRTWRCSG